MEKKTHQPVLPIYDSLQTSLHQIQEPISCPSPTSSRKHHSPPVLVELSIGKPCELTHYVKIRVEVRVEEHQPEEMIGNLELIDKFEF